VAASTLVYQLLPAGTSRAQRICSHMEHTQDLLLPGWRSEHAGRDSSCRHSDRDAYDRRSVTAALLNLGGAEIVGSPEEPTTVRYGRVRRVLDRLTDLPRIVRLIMVTALAEAMPAVVRVRRGWCAATNLITSTREGHFRGRRLEAAEPIDRL